MVNDAIFDFLLQVNLISGAFLKIYTNFLKSVRMRQNFGTILWSIYVILEKKSFVKQRKLVKYRFGHISNLNFPKFIRAFHPSQST